MKARPRISFTTPALESCAGVVFAQLRFWPRELKARLGRMGLSEDLSQHCYMIAVQCWREGLHPAAEPSHAKLVSKAAQRELYRFLTGYGFRKPRGTGRFERYEDSTSDFRWMDKILLRKRGKA